MERLEFVLYWCKRVCSWVIKILGVWLLLSLLTVVFFGDKLRNASEDSIKIIDNQSMDDEVSEVVVSDSDIAKVDMPIVSEVTQEVEVEEVEEVEEVKFDEYTQSIYDLLRQHISLRIMDSEVVTVTNGTDIVVEFVVDFSNNKTNLDLDTELMSFLDALVRLDVKPTTLVIDMGVELIDYTEKSYSFVDYLDIVIIEDTFAEIENWRMVDLRLAVFEYEIRDMLLYALNEV